MKTTSILKLKFFTRKMTSKLCIRETQDKIKKETFCRMKKLKKAILEAINFYFSN